MSKPKIGRNAEGQLVLTDRDGDELTVVPSRFPPGSLVIQIELARRTSMPAMVSLTPKQIRRLRRVLKDLRTWRRNGGAKPSDPRG